MTRPRRKRIKKPLPSRYDYGAERREIWQAVAALRAEPPSTRRDKLLAAIREQSHDKPWYDETANWREWIHSTDGIIEATCHEGWEHDKRRELSTEDDIRLDESPPESASHPDKDKRRQRNVDAAGLLSHQLRAVDLLRAGLTREEIAAELGIKAEALRQLFMRIKAKIQNSSSPSPSGE